jgi:hypothetical protein
MFLTPKVPALFKKGTLKLVDDDGPSVRRVGGSHAGDRAVPGGNSRTNSVKRSPGTSSTAPTTSAPSWRAIDLRDALRTAEGHRRSSTKTSAPCATLTPVSIKDVSVTRIEDKKTGRAWLSLACVLVFSLEDKAARNFVLDEFGKTLLWTFTGNAATSC